MFHRLAFVADTGSEREKEKPKSAYMHVLQSDEVTFR